MVSSFPCKYWSSCQYQVLNCLLVIRNAQTVFSKLKHISPLNNMDRFQQFLFQLKSLSKTKIERERKHLVMYKENTILFSGSHTSCVHNPRSLWKKSNSEENQTLQSININAGCWTGFCVNAWSIKKKPANWAGICM